MFEDQEEVGGIKMIPKSKSPEVFVGEKEDFVSDTGLELKPVDEG